MRSNMLSPGFSLNETVDSGLIFFALESKKGLLRGWEKKRNGGIGGRRQAASDGWQIQ